MLNRWSKLSKIDSRITVVIAGITLLYYISYKNYLLFHTLMELINIIIGFSIYIITKNTHKVSQNNYFIFLGTCFILIGCFDLLHVLTYKGMNVFSGDIANMSVQFRVISGFMLALSFMVFCILLYRKEKPVKLSRLLAIFYVLSGILAIAVYRKIFPICFVEGEGNTVFKILAEMFICLILAFVLALLGKKKINLYENISQLLVIAVGILILMELSFTFYKDTKDFINITGHMFKLASYYLIYKAIIKTTLENPYNVLFYRLTEINSSLEVKTRQLMKINSRLNDEIGERKLIEEKLRDSKKSYQELLDFLPYSILVHSEGKLVYVNNASLRLLNYSEYKEVLGKDILDFVHPDYKDITSKRINKVYDNEPLEFEELKLVKANGQTIDVETKAVPYIYKNKVSSLVVIGDITERKKAEEKDIALKEAMEYDRIKNEFMANISHELRTPLNVIFGATQLFEYYSENNSICDNRKNIAKYSKSMKQNCYRMLRLVNNLIDLTKIDSGFLRLNLQNHNIVSIVEEITLSVASYIESKNINIQFDTEVEEKCMAFDVDMIERIILNLLSNAVKFTPENGNIYVNIYDKEEQVIISVKDTGIGIPEDKKEYIFDRFRQVDKSFVRKTEGSGIGLNLVKSIVELHGGQVHVESEYGNGSNFIVKLPAITVPYDEVAATADIPQGKVESIHIEFSDIYS